MTAEFHNHPSPTPPRNPPAQLKKIGWIVLLSGLVVAAVIYAFGADTAPPDDNSLESQYYKREQADVQRLWGNEGSMVLGFTRMFHRASTYSVIVLIVSVAFALICFYLASPPPEGNKKA